VLKYTVQLISGDPLLANLKVKTGVYEFKYTGYQCKCKYRKTYPCIMRRI
jgi:hypothetical protein